LNIIVVDGGSGGSSGGGTDFAKELALSSMNLLRKNG
jgi:hypothetical protein